MATETAITWTGASVVVLGSPFVPRALNFDALLRRNIVPAGWTYDLDQMMVSPVMSMLRYTDGQQFRMEDDRLQVSVPFEVADAEAGRDQPVGAALIFDQLALITRGVLAWMPLETLRGIGFNFSAECAMASAAAYLDGLCPADEARLAGSPGRPQLREVRFRYPADSDRGDMVMTVHLELEEPAPDDEASGGLPWLSVAINCHRRLAAREGAAGALDALPGDFEAAVAMTGALLELSREDVLQSFGGA